MNLPRLRELVKAGENGTLRPEELKELFEALPEVIEAAERPMYVVKAPIAPPTQCESFDYDGYAGRFGY